MTLIELYVTGIYKTKSKMILNHRKLKCSVIHVVTA